jgi:hypothetical protein
MGSRKTRKMQSTEWEHIHIKFVCYIVIYIAVCYFQIQASIATYTAILTATPEFYSVGLTNNISYIPVYIIGCLHAKCSYLCKTYCTVRNSNIMRHTQTPSSFRKLVTLTLRLKYYMNGFVCCAFSSLEAATETYLT